MPALGILLTLLRSEIVPMYMGRFLFLVHYYSKEKKGRGIMGLMWAMNSKDEVYIRKEYYHFAIL